MDVDLEDCEETVRDGGGFSELLDVVIVAEGVLDEEVGGDKTMLEV